MRLAASVIHTITGLVGSQSPYFSAVT